MLQETKPSPCDHVCVFSPIPQYGFSSFLHRNKSYKVIVKVWENSLSDHVSLCMQLTLCKYSFSPIVQFTYSMLKQRGKGLGMRLTPVIVSRSVTWLVTVLSQASAYGCSQFEYQKSGVGGYTKEVLEWFNYPCTTTHPGCEGSCQGVPNRPASSLCPCFIEASRQWRKLCCARKWTNP